MMDLIFLNQIKMHNFVLKKITTGCQRKEEWTENTNDKTEGKCLNRGRDDTIKAFPTGTG